MADLSDEQLSFLRKYLGFDQKGFLQKRRLKEQLQDFWRRREKTEAELKILPPDHPQLDALKKAVADATGKAEGGDLKGAYADLKQVKASARQEATIEKSGLNANVVSADLQLLNNIVTAAERSMTAIRSKVANQAARLMGLAQALPDPGSAKGREALLQLAGENARAKADILGQWQGVAPAVTQDLQNFSALLAASPKIALLSDRVAHRMAVLNKEKPGTLRSSDQSLFLGLVGRIKSNNLTGNGSQLRSEIQAALTAHENALRTLLAAKTAFGPLIAKTTFTDAGGKAMSPQDEARTRSEIEDRFRHLDEREEERLERAKEAYRLAVEQDQNAMRITVTRRPTKDARVRPFDTASVTDGVPGGVMSPTLTDDQAAQACADSLGKVLSGLLKGGTVPDEAFEMCTRSPEDWVRSVAEAAGIPYLADLRKKMDPKVLARIEAVAKAMRQKAVELYPNKAKSDFSEFTMDGETYGQVTLLGQGGGGRVFTAVDSKGRKVVLKRPLTDIDPADMSEHDLAALRDEALNHRSVTGGEDGDCHRNILDMKGMVLGPVGEPLVVMDLADAGDAENYTNSVDALEGAGLIPESARLAMMGAAVRDMVRGMRAMQDQGMTHHDLKEANVFLMKDGTFKVADFGLAHHVDGRDGAVDEEFDQLTPGYQPPELQGEGALTQKGDNFTLGEILEKMTRPLHKTDTIQDSFSTSQAAPSQVQTADGGPSSASALDRLVNALKEPDPAKRPTLDGVLLSSYMIDIDENREALDRLKAATAKYAATVGRKTGKLSDEITRTEAAIRKLLAQKSDRYQVELVDNYRRNRADIESRLKKVTAISQKADAALQAVETSLKTETDPDEIERLTVLRKSLKLKANDRKKVMDYATKELSNADTKLKAETAKLGQQKTPAELAKIDSQIEALRKKVVDLRKQIDAIHADPANKPIVDEVKAAATNSTGQDAAGDRAPKAPRRPPPGGGTGSA